MGGLPDYTVIAKCLTCLVARKDGLFRELTALRPAHFADFGKRETSFGNMSRSHWKQAALVVSFGHEHKK
jgi:hypothetical protein